MSRAKSSHIDSAAAVGERLRSARLRADLSQQALARACSCSPGYLSRLERGERVPSLQLLRELGRHLGVTADHLATGREAADEDGDAVLVEAELSLRFSDYGQAETLYRRALEDARPALTMRACAGLGLIAAHRGDHGAAIELLEEALGSGTLPPLDTYAAADALGRSLALMGELDRAIALFERHLRDARRRDETTEVIRFSVLLANALMDAGNCGRSSEVLAAVTDDAARMADPIVRARIWWSQSRLHDKLKNAEAAARYARLALETLTQTEHVEYAARAHQLLAHIEIDRGNPGEALRLIETAYPLIVASGNRFEQAMFRLERARALAALGETEEAASLALEVSGTFTDTSPANAGRAYGLVARLFRDLGDPARACELYELACETLAPTDTNRLEYATELAAILEADGRGDEALRVLRGVVTDHLRPHPGSDATPADAAGESRRGG